MHRRSGARFMPVFINLKMAGRVTCQWLQDVMPGWLFGQARVLPRCALRMTMRPMRIDHDQCGDPAAVRQSRQQAETGDGALR